MRGQANLIALATAVVVLTAAMLVGLGIAGAAFDDAERDATERTTAVNLAESLTHPDSPLTTRKNVLNATAVARFDGKSLDSQYASLDDHDATVGLDGEPVATTGDATTGATIRRIVLVEERQSVIWTPSMSETADNSVTLPRRTDRIVVRLDPDDTTTVTTVRIDGRVELRNDSGVTGEHALDVSPLETASVRFEASGELSEDDVEIEYFPTRTRSAVLEVSVDA